MLYRIADYRMDHHLFHQGGVAILTWPVKAAQPTATVLTSEEVFSVLLIDVPERMRELLNLGSYRAQYSNGYVKIWLWPLNRYR